MVISISALGSEFGFGGGAGVAAWDEELSCCCCFFFPNSEPRPLTTASELFVGTESLELLELEFDRGGALEEFCEESGAPFGEAGIPMLT